MSGKTIRFLEERDRYTDEQSPEVALEILRAVKEIRYGSVEIVVHDGRVVQIERKEKIRIGQEGLAGKK